MASEKSESHAKQEGRLGSFHASELFHRRNPMLTALFSPDQERRHGNSATIAASLDFC